VIVVTKPITMVEVVAPATLQEGFKFRAMYQGVQFPVIVVSVYSFISYGFILVSSKNTI
jgi:hypothetical protein